MNLPVRFFVVSYEDEADIIEVSEQEFLAHDGRISYERNTVFQNGVNQICLTKGLDHA
jgi:hypothetical protein